MKGDVLAKPIVTDELWEIVEPLIPKVKRRTRYPGRHRIHDRKVQTVKGVKTPFHHAAAR